MLPNINKISSGTIWKGIFYITTYVLNISIASYYGAGESASFFYLLNNLGFVVLICNAGIDSAITYYCSTKQISYSLSLKYAVLWSLFCAAIFYFLLIIFKPENFLLLSTLFVFGNMLNNYISSLFYISGEYYLPNTILSLMNLLLVILMFASRKEELTIYIFTECYLIIQMVSAIIMLISISSTFTRNEKSMRNRNTDVSIKTIASYSLKAFWIAILTALMLRSDIWIVSHYTNSTELGNYIQSGKLVQLVIVIPSLSAFALFPLLAEKSITKQSQFYSITSLIKKYFISSLVIGILMGIVGFWLVPLVFGVSYLLLYKLLLLLIPGLICYAASFPINIYFAAHNMQHVNIKSIFFALVAMVILDFLLVPNYGVYAAAIVSTLAYSIYFFLLLNKFICIHKIKLTVFLKANNLQ